MAGDGNSAFTAVRDLLRYASEVHLVHVDATFTADPVLVEEVRRAEAEGRVQFHLDSQVREYLGREHLEGLRLADAGGKPRHDLAVDGVFLEIGLEPNSKPWGSLSCSMRRARCR